MNPKSAGRKKRKYICGGYETSSPDGTEYDCEYGDGEITCDECICNSEIGGNKMPKGMRWKMVSRLPNQPQEKREPER